jgi:hypothetical protein
VGRAAEQRDEADEAFGGTNPRAASGARPEVPPNARAASYGRGHRFAAYPRCSADRDEGGDSVTHRAKRVFLKRLLLEASISVLAASHEGNLGTAVAHAAEPVRVCTAEDAKRPGVLALRVVDSLNEPLPGATVTVLDPLKSVVIATATTRANGIASFRALGPEPVFIIAALPGFATAGRTIASDPECLTKVAIRLDVQAQ